MPLGDHAAHWANYLGELGSCRCTTLLGAKCRRSRRRGSWQRLGPSLTCVPTWNPIAGHKSMRPSSNIYKRSTMAKRLLLRKDGELSYSRVPVVDPHLLLDTYYWRRILEPYGQSSICSNTPSDVHYTEDEIMAIVHGGKQRGHFLGVGRVLLGQGTVIPPSTPCTHSSDVATLKKREKLLTKNMNMFMKLFKSDNKFSQMLTQLESQPEYGGGSGSGGCGDELGLGGGWRVGVVGGGCGG
ncbi:hypothetical protein Tco_0683749 [Tanacetum coccineum]